MPGELNLDVDSTPAKTPHVIGTCLGPYEVVARIGAGGMGEVFRARHQAESRRRDQSAADGCGERSGSARSLQPRSASPRVAQPSEHRRYLWRRRQRRRARARHGNRRRTDAGGSNRPAEGQRSRGFRSTKRCPSPDRSRRRSKRRTTWVSSLPARAGVGECGERSRPPSRYRAVPAGARARKTSFSRCARCRRWRRSSRIPACCASSTSTTRGGRTALFFSDRKQCVRASDVHHALRQRRRGHQRFTDRVRRRDV